MGASTLDGLNEYSQGIASRLFQAHPEWLAHASVEDGALVVRIPSPIKGAPEVAIYTDDQELTVGFDRWHEHFDCWSDIPQDEAFADALSCVHDLLSEKLAVAVTMRAEEWLGSQTLGEGEEPPAPKPGERVYVASFKGKRNAETRAA